MHIAVREKDIALKECKLEIKRRELALIEQKEGELKQEIEENQRRAANETDPEKKRKFIFLADQAKEE